MSFTVARTNSLNVVTRFSHLGSRQSLVRPDNANDWNIDFRENISGRGLDREYSQQQDENFAKRQTCAACRAQA
jgi:hypothetical protein